MLIPIIAGSDKTTVSVATGHQEYHPLYIGAGNISNTMRRSHSVGMELAALLPIPKSKSLPTMTFDGSFKFLTPLQASKKHRRQPQYQTFCRQLYHACLEKVFSVLRPSMTEPKIAMCPDGYFRRVVFSLGPYIADYPEQVWLAGIVQNWCPW
jgi:Plavaka transposase